MDTRNRKKAQAAERFSKINIPSLESKVRCSAKSPDGEEMLCVIRQRSENAYYIEIKENRDILNPPKRIKNSYVQQPKTNEDERISGEATEPLHGVRKPLKRAAKTTPVGDRKGDIDKGLKTNAENSDKSKAIERVPQPKMSQKSFNEDERISGETTEPLHGARKRLQRAAKTIPANDREAGPKETKTNAKNTNKSSVVAVHLPKSVYIPVEAVKKGQIILCKVRGFCPWPGVVIGFDNNLISVEFFGDHTTYKASINNFFKFEESGEAIIQNLRSKKNPLFSKAVREAESVMGISEQDSILNRI